MVSRPSGRVMEVRALQPQKQLLPKLVMEFERVTEVRAPQLMKQRSPTLVTVLGMVMEVSSLLVAKQ